MIYIYIFLALLALGGAFYALWPYFGKEVHHTEKEHLLELVDKGIGYEEDFISEYLKVVRNEGFMEFFGTHKLEADSIIKVLVDQSTEHKLTLTAVRKKFFG